MREGGGSSRAPKYLPPRPCCSQVLWLLGNITSDAGAAAEFIAADGAAALIATLWHLAPTPEDDALLLALVALAALAQHGADSLAAAGAASAVIECMSVATRAGATAVAEAACVALSQLLAAASAASGLLCDDLAACGAAIILTAVLAGSERDVSDQRDRVSRDVGTGDLSLASHAAQALLAVLLLAQARGRAEVDGTEPHRATVARVLLAAVLPGASRAAPAADSDPGTGASASGREDSESEDSDRDRKVLVEALRGIILVCASSGAAT